MKQKLLESLAKVLPETISLALGAGLASVGRLTQEHWIPVVPPTMDLIGGFPMAARRLTNCIAYGIGVALPYADLIIANL